MMFVLLGVILAAPFFVSEWIGVSERMAWAESDNSLVRSRWRQQLNTGANTLIAAIGLAMLVAFPVHPLDLLDWLILLIYSWYGLSLLWATDRRRASGPIACMLSIGCAVFGVGLTCTFHECLIVVATGAAFYLVTGMLHELFGIRRELRPYRFWGVVGCNHQAAEAVLLLYLVVYFYQTGTFNPPTTVFLAVCLTITLMLTRSRTVIYAATTGSLAWALAYPPVRREVIIPFTCGLIGLALVTLIPAIRSRAWSLLLLGRNQEELKTLNGRTILWSCLWPQVLRHPVFGSGYASIWNDAHQVALHKMYPFGSRMHQAHCVYLDFLINGGIIGLSLYLTSLSIAGSAAFSTDLPTGPFLIGWITFAAIHGVCESSLALPNRRAFAFFAILVAMTV